MQIEQYARVYAEVDLDALHYNMEQMRQKISPDTRIMGIIKADGYGHGAVSLGRELEPLDYVFGYGVATAEEAFILRDCLILRRTAGFCCARFTTRLIRKKS